MSEYLRPDVYIERTASGERPISAASTSVGAFVGIAPRGQVGKAMLCTNWSEFLEKTSLGLDTPFIANSDLAYAVYGFFQNGGSRCYVVRTAHSTVAKASVKIPETTGITFTALDEGTWANSKVAIVVTSNTTVPANFDVVVKFNGVEVERFENCSNTAADINYYDIKINGVSKYVTVELLKSLAVGTGTLAGGVDGVSDIVDGDYTGNSGLNALDGINVNLVAVPGQTSLTVINAITAYCELRGDCFAILDAPMGDSVQDVATFKATLNASDYGAYYFPWIKVVDPLSSVGRLRTTPPSGHIMGMYARTDTKRGVHKAPAGDEATLLGVVDLELSVGSSGLATLNPLAVNSIIAKPNVGIVVWGARTLSTNTKRLYVSDVRMDINVEVSCKAGTSWVVFEPNDEILWKRFSGSLESYLYSLWLDGKLKGTKKEEAYYVKCDAELNPQTSIDAGKVIAEIAYAKKRPAEFVIIKIVQKSAE
jgi:phage tail sheath protein FI